jgi:hypothetical protein
MAEQNDISHVLRQRCDRISYETRKKNSDGKLEVLQNAYGTETMKRAQCMDDGRILKTERKG